MQSFTQVWEGFVKKISGIPENIPESITELAVNPLSLAVIILLFVGLLLVMRFGKIKFTPALLAQMALAIAMAIVLNMFIVYRMPQGGSVTLASMVPLVLLALAYGPSVGLMAGFVFGLLDLLMGAYLVHPLQVLLDYPIPYMFIGLAGILPRHMNLGTIFAFFLRFVAHLISGVVFFYMYTPEGMSPLWYSTLYNGSFLLADMAICLIVLNILPVNRLAKAMNPRAPQISR